MTVARLDQRLCYLSKLCIIDPAIMPGNLLRTGDFQPLPVFDGVDELAGFKHLFVCAGIEPSVTAPHGFNVKLAAFQVKAIEIGDFQLTAR